MYFPTVSIYSYALLPKHHFLCVTLQINTQTLVLLFSKHIFIWFGSKNSTSGRRDDVGGLLRGQQFQLQDTRREDMHYLLVQAELRHVHVPLPH